MKHDTDALFCTIDPVFHASDKTPNNEVVSRGINGQNLMVLVNPREVRRHQQSIMMGKN